LDELPTLFSCINRRSSSIGLLYPNHELLCDRFPDELAKALEKKRAQIAQLAGPRRMVDHDQ
jgi:hypothetical protein